MRKCRKQTEVERSRFAQMLYEMKADGITQSDLASSVGTTQSFVSNLKAGRAALSVPLAKEIERAFPKYRAAWLLGLDESTVSKVDALEVLNPIVSDLSPERRYALLEYVQDFIEFELRKDRV